MGLSLRHSTNDDLPCMGAGGVGWTDNKGQLWFYGGLCKAGTDDEASESGTARRVEHTGGLNDGYTYSRCRTMHTTVIALVTAKRY